MYCKTIFSTQRTTQHIYVLLQSQKMFIVFTISSHNILISKNLSDINTWLGLPLPTHKSHLPHVRFRSEILCWDALQVQGVYWRMEIAERGYSGSAEEMEFAGSDPLRITWENRGDEFFVPVKASEASITILCHDNFLYIGTFYLRPQISCEHLSQHRPLLERIRGG